MYVYISVYMEVCVVYECMYSYVFICLQVSVCVAFALSLSQNDFLFLCLLILLSSALHVCVWSCHCDWSS